MVFRITLQFAQRAGHVPQADLNALHQLAVVGAAGQPALETGQRALVGRQRVVQPVLVVQRVAQLHRRAAEVEVGVDRGEHRRRQRVHALLFAGLQRPGLGMAIEKAKPEGPRQPRAQQGDVQFTLLRQWHPGGLGAAQGLHQQVVGLPGQRDLLGRVVAAVAAEQRAHVAHVTQVLLKLPGRRRGGLRPGR